MRKYFSRKNLLSIILIFFIIILIGKDVFADYVLNDSNKPSYSILQTLKDNGITLVVILTALLVFLKEFWEEIGSNSIASNKVNFEFYIIIGAIILSITLSIIVSNILFNILDKSNDMNISSIIYALIQIILIKIIFNHSYAPSAKNDYIELKKLSDEESRDNETCNKNFGIEINNKNSEEQKEQTVPINYNFYLIISIANIVLSSKYILDYSKNSIDFLMKSVFLLLFILATIIIFKDMEIANNLKLYSIRRDKDSIHAIILSDEEDFFYIRQLNYNTKKFDRSSYIRKSDIKKLEVEDNVEFVFYKPHLRYTIRNSIMEKYNKFLSHFSKK